jgi:hypothetical protein
MIITAGSRWSIYYEELFQKIKILPLASKYLISLPSFTVDNTERFEPESEPHGTVTLLRTILSAVVKSRYCVAFLQNYCCR